MPAATAKKKKPTTKVAVAPKTRRPAVAKAASVPARRRQPEQVLARILEAATAAFTNDGYKGARMRSIATDAGVSIQLLVYHAKTKEDLWHMVMENILKRYEIFAAETAALPKTASAAERLRHMIADIVHYTADSPHLFRIMTREGAQLTPRLIWIMENFSKKGFEEFVELAEAAKAEGAIRQNIDSGRLRYAVMAMASLPFSVSAEYEFFTGKNPFTRNEVAKTIELIHHMVFVD